MITSYLRDRHALTVNRKRVRRLMREMGIYMIYSKPNLRKISRFIKNHLTFMSWLYPCGARKSSMIFRCRFKPKKQPARMRVALYARRSFLIHPICK